MLSLHHPKIQMNSSLSQRSLWQDKNIQLQAEDSQSSSHRQEQRISCPPVKARNLWKKEEVANSLGPSAERQPLDEWDISRFVPVPSQDCTGQNSQCTLEASETPPGPSCCRLTNYVHAFTSLTTFILANLSFKPEGQAPGQHYHVIIQHQKASC